MLQQVVHILTTEPNALNVAHAAKPVLAETLHVPKHGGILDQEL